MSKKSVLDGIDAIADEDLVDALARIARWARTEFGPEVELAAPDEEKKVSSTIKHEVLLIVREAIANTAKHAGAKKARIDITSHLGRLTVAVIDFSTGFDSSEAEKRAAPGSHIFLYCSSILRGAWKFH